MYKLQIIPDRPENKSDYKNRHLAFLEEITTLVYLCDVYFHIFLRTTQLVIILYLFTFGNSAIFVNNRSGIERVNSARTDTGYTSPYNVEAVFTISSVKN